MDKKIYRVIDANLNRTREALRVSEDIVRYILGSRTLTRDLKEVRHGVTEAIRALPRYRTQILPARSPTQDVGRKTSASESRRRDYADILFANLERAKESLRVLEEFFKLFDAKSSEQFKTLRYRLYGIEKRISGKLESLPRPRQSLCP